MPHTSMSSSFNPLVVTAGVPSLTPLVTNEDNIEKVKGMVAELTAKYPLDM